jgi:hypothetical protein
MNANKADWLRWVVYLATIGFETEQLLAEAETEPKKELNKSECELCSEESSKTIAIKDHLIEDLQTVNSQLQEQLKTAQYSLEEANLQHQAELTRAKIDAVNDFALWAHDHCWLEGADLVCSLELIDKYLLSCIKDDHIDPPTVAPKDLSETICMDEGPNQFNTVYYKPNCPHGYEDCVWDPMYIYSTYPKWYASLYGDKKPEEVVCDNCKDGERYDDEDK